MVQTELFSLGAVVKHIQILIAYHLINTYAICVTLKCLITNLKVHVTVFGGYFVSKLWWLGQLGEFTILWHLPYSYVVFKMSMPSCSHAF